MRNVNRLEASVLILAIVDGVISFGTLLWLRPVGVGWLWPPSIQDQPAVQACSLVLWISTLVLIGMAIHLWIKTRREDGAS